MFLACVCRFCHNIVPLSLSAPVLDIPVDVTNEVESRFELVDEFPF